MTHAKNNKKNTKNVQLITAPFDQLEETAVGRQYISLCEKKKKNKVLDGRRVAREEPTTASLFAAAA